MKSGCDDREQAVEKKDENEGDGEESDARHFVEEAFHGGRSEVIGDQHERRDVIGKIARRITMFLSFDVCSMM